MVGRCLRFIILQVSLTTKFSRIKRLSHEISRGACNLGFHTQEYKKEKGEKRNSKQLQAYGYSQNCGLLQLNKFLGAYSWKGKTI